jgi:6-phosphofructokinase
MVNARLARQAGKGGGAQSITPQEFHIIGLELTIDRHDWNPFDHGLGYDQAIKRVLVVIREFGASNGYQEGFS